MPSKKRSRTTEDNPTSMVCDCGFVFAQANPEEANIAMHENSPAHQRRLKMTAATPRPVTLFFRPVQPSAAPSVTPPAVAAEPASVPAVEALPDDVVMDQDAADEDASDDEDTCVDPPSQAVVALAASALLATPPVQPSIPCPGWKDPQWPSPFASHYPWTIHSDRKFERKCLWTATSSGNFFSRNCTRFVSEPGQPCDACSGLASLDKLTALRERASCKSNLVGHKHATWTPHQLLTALKEAQAKCDALRVSVYESQQRLLRQSDSLGMHKHLPE